MILAVTTSTTIQALWYLTRATGLVSLVLLTLVMALGICQYQQWAPSGWPRFVAAALHRNASLVAVAFLVVHVLTAVIDPYAPIDLAAAVLPFSSPYRTLWLGLGAVAFDLVLALTATSLLRERIGHRTWRTIHWAAYACWPIAFVHGLGTGSDGRVEWVVVLDLACLAIILAAVGWRLASNWKIDPARRLAGAATSAVAVVVVLAWVATGPTQPGWARRAGTPTALLGSTRAAAASGGSTSRGGAALTVPLHAGLSGTLTQSGGGRRATVTIDATLDGRASNLQIVLQGDALADGGLALRQGVVSLGPIAHPDAYTGPVTDLSGTTITARLRAPANGGALTAHVQLQIDPTSQQVTGTIDVT
jgi:methionine sulfoxide reductase heme-binding subunit